VVHGTDQNVFLGVKTEELQSEQRASSEIEEGSTFFYCQPVDL
jgi:hypothetical protein